MSGSPVSSEYLKAIYENTPGRITTIDPQGRILTTNRVSKGASLDKVLGAYIWDLYLPQYHRQAREVIARVLETGRPGDYEVQLKRPTGQLRWYHVRVGRLDLPGVEPQLILFGTDIGRRKEMELALAESEERYRTVVENANVGITVVAEGRMLYFNDKALEITGYTAEEFAALPNRDTVHPEDRALTRRYREMRQAGLPAPERYDFRIIRKDGQVRWINFCPVHNISWHGKNAILQFFSDITESKLAEEALRESEAHLKSLMESAEEFAIFRFVWEDEHPVRSRVLLFSPSAKDILGMDDPFDLDAWSERVHPDDLPIVEDSLSRGARTGSINHIYRFYHAVKKRWVWIQVVAKATRDETGRPKFGNGIVLDISDRIRLEKQAAQAQRLQAIGRLAAGIAHEINSPAQHLTSNAFFLWNAFTRLTLLIDQLTEVVDTAKSGRPLQAAALAELEQTAQEIEVEFLFKEVPEAIQSMISGLGRITEIIKSVRQLAHPGGQDKEEVLLSEVIDKAVEVTRNQWQPVARLEVKVEPGLGPIKGLAGELNQVLVNLIVNAAQALAGEKGGPVPAGGRIEISVRQGEQGQELSVADNGSGLPAGAGKEVFEPFFTTKKAGQGTGLGLAICRNIIVDKHGGRLKCFDRPTGGACFTVVLPVDSEAAYVKE